MNNTGTVSPLYPKTISVNYWGKVKTMTFQGIGAYPYECISKDKFPNAAIYVGDGSWDSFDSPQIQSRDKSLDIY